MLLTLQVVITLSLSIVIVSLSPSLTIKNRKRRMHKNLSTSSACCHYRTIIIIISSLSLSSYHFHCRVIVIFSDNQQAKRGNVSLSANLHLRAPTFARKLSDAQNLNCNIFLVSKWWKITIISKSYSCQCQFKGSCRMPKLF